jgi:hypothetical protein
MIVTLSPTSTDQNLRVYDPNRNLLGSSSNSDNAIDSYTFYASTSGYYYAIVYGYQAGSYIISVSSSGATPTPLPTSTPTPTPTVTVTYTPPVAGSAGTVTRSFSSSIAPPGNTITITLTPSPSTLFDTPGYSVIETLPAGFTYVSDTAEGRVQSGQTITFTRLGASPITYTVLAARSAGTTFTGTFKDEVRNSGNVGGSSVILVGSRTPGTITRSISSSSVPPDGTLTITLTPSPTGLFDAPGYRVIETIPTGFTYLSTTAGVTVEGNVVTLTQIGSSPITYTLRAPSTTGSYVISGIFMDELTNVGIVAGTTSIRVGAGYDTNGDGRIDRSEAIQAVMDYFNGLITRQEAIDVVMAYFSG